MSEQKVDLTVLEVKLIKEELLGSPPTPVDTAGQAVHPVGHTNSHIDLRPYHVL